MKRISLALLAALVIFNFTACKKGENEKKVEEPAPVVEKAKNDCSTLTVDSLKAKIASPPNVTEDEYATILEAMACCTVDEKSFVIEKDGCAALQAVDALKKDGSKFPSLRSVAARLAKHESPLVRAKAYEAFSGLFGASDKDISVAKEAIENEKDLYALHELISGLSNEGGRNPEIGKFLLDMGKHENPLLRKKAAMALANPWSVKVDGVVDAVIALMSDSNENVAGEACGGAGGLNDERVIDPIVNILNDENKTSFEMHTRSFRHVVEFSVP